MSSSNLIILFIPIVFIFRANAKIDSSSNSIKIEGFKSVNQINNDKVKIRASHAEIMKLSASILLYDVALEFENENKIILYVSADEALFHENEIIFQKNTKVRLNCAKNNNKNSNGFLFSIHEPVLFDLKNQSIGGASAEYQIKNIKSEKIISHYIGNSFKLNISNYELVWIGTLKDLLKRKEISVPFKMNILDSVCHNK